MRAIKKRQASWRPSESLISRIKRSYRLGIAGSHQEGHIHEALLRDDEAALRLLSDPAKTNLYYGVDNLAADIVRDMPDSSEAAGLVLVAEVETLAEALGLRATFNPEGGSRFPGQVKSPESIDRRLFSAN